MTSVARGKISEFVLLWGANVPNTPAGLAERRNGLFPGGIAKQGRGCYPGGFSVEGCCALEKQKDKDEKSVLIGEGCLVGSSSAFREVKEGMTLRVQARSLGLLVGGGQTKCKHPTSVFYVS